MTDAWFSPQAASLFSLLSLLSLCSLFVIPARRGLFRGLALTVWYTMIALGLTLVGAGSVAALTNQPLHVSRTLVLSGLIVALVFAVTRRGLLRGYQEAELRRTVAADL
jgi:hypothetical protein